MHGSAILAPLTLALALAEETAASGRAALTAFILGFEGHNGLFRTHGLADRSEPAATVAELGRRWEIGRVSIKPYPCCHFAHGAVDCALGLFADGISAARVSAIQAIIDEVAAGFVCKPIRSKQAPGNTYGAKFSLPYLIARAG